MAEDLDLKEFLTKEEIQAFLRKERELQASDSGIMNTKNDLEILANLDNDANEIPDSKPLLESYETLAPTSEKCFAPARNRLELVTDSLMDLRVQKLKIKEKIEPKTSKLKQKEIRRNRYELYFCYVLYFTLVFLAFSFAIYVWIPIFKGMFYENPKPNAKYYKEGSY